MWEQWQVKPLFYWEELLSALIDLTGQRFGKLIVIERVEHKNSGAMWKCLCDCGKEKIIHSNSLRKGLTKSCGCIQKEMASKAKSTHRLSNHPLFGVFRNMHQRCEDVNHCKYQNYGGRGISVCKDWEDPNVFIKWCIKNGWDKNLEIDRIDNNGNYEPSNCHFISHLENNAIGKKNMKINNTTGYVGVFMNSKGRYIAQLSHPNCKRHLGIFNTIEEAIEARKQKEIELFGEQKTNFGGVNEN